MVLCIIITFILSFITVTICAFCFKPHTILVDYIQNIIILLITLIFSILDERTNKKIIENNVNG